MAVYGTPCLFSWSESLEDLDKCFHDNSVVDSTRLMNDSAFRNTYWACYSTTLGGLLHEFSHILDIGHNLTGIMARGFDDLNQFFTINFSHCSCFLQHENVRPILFIRSFKKYVSNKLIRFYFFGFRLNQIIFLLKESQQFRIKLKVERLI